ncbi:hypothetical protein [Caloramator australicus]|uniref:Uncharacterized protein n=1 Tax=Caloramator australicus RC3 TaxID=857293 RepID=I7LKA0_9CLOT|nr:hypothetical protein [Caloramator australicus]CCJ34298.1 hypothetical protein CAAU_2214 [Caloramator australicus RC3]
MATSSFNKNFILDSEKAVESFTRIILEKPQQLKIDRSLTSPERQKEGENKLKRMLSR